MQITYLGHAGFCVETENALVVMDPWLSPEGAFDSAWFQFPRNHHLAVSLRERLLHCNKERFVYVSHEHHDHFDPEFLKSLPNHQLTYVVPHFQRPALRHELSGLHPKAVISCTHGQEVPIPGGFVKLYLQDSGLSRDSGVLLKAANHTFLNLNDCKLYDELPSIVNESGPLSVFTCQFSGATWHPICYDYEPQEYERISSRKVSTKFEMIARAIETAKAQVYIPSAGPACFLDPTLMHLNFEPVNIFPRAPQFLGYLAKKLCNPRTRAINPMPGDVFDLDRMDFIAQSSERVDEANVEDYLRAYAEEYRPFFAERQAETTRERAEAVIEMLRVELERKLSSFMLRARLRIPLYFGLSDFSDIKLRIDFPRGVTERVSGISDSDFYSIVTPSWQIVRVLSGDITWEDFALTFRMRLNRRPDIYQTLIQGFLLMEAEDMNWFCSQLIEIESKRNRVVVEAGGTRYSMDRFCPHQGGDLSKGWADGGSLWTCPRHRWQFDLDNGGRCLTSDATVNAVCLEND